MLWLMGCTSTSYNSPAKIVNFERASKNLYRSGQLTTSNQWWYVANVLGVKKDIKLNYPKEGSDNIATNFGITIIEVPMPPSGIMDWYKGPGSNAYFYVISEIKESLDKEEVVLVHCSHGQDRTGIVIGGAKVILLGWNKEVAWEDMREHHYHTIFVGLNKFWNKYVK